MSNLSPGRKLLMSYDMLPDSGQAYYEFMLGRYIPMMQSMGLMVSEAWGTAYGNGPDRLIGFVSRDEETMYELLDSDVWDELNMQLLDYVADFRYKVIPYKEGFQI